jgi:hypothetical protein
VASPTRSDRLSPSVECAANAIPGCSTGAREPGPPGAGTSSPPTSSIGTANDGTTRRGSHTSSARRLSTTASPSIRARSRFSMGS